MPLSQYIPYIRRYEPARPYAHLKSGDSVAVQLPKGFAVSLVELEGGIVAEPRLAATRRALLDALPLDFPVLDFDSGCVAAYRRIIEARGFSRSKVVDRMIAATALRHALR